MQAAGITLLICNILRVCVHVVEHSYRSQTLTKGRLSMFHYREILIPNKSQSFLKWLLIKEKALVNCHSPLEHKHSSPKLQNLPFHLIHHCNRSNVNPHICSFKTNFCCCGLVFFRVSLWEGLRQTMMPVHSQSTDCDRNTTVDQSETACKWSFTCSVTVIAQMSTSIARKNSCSCGLLGDSWNATSSRRYHLLWWGV